MNTLSCSVEIDAPVELVFDRCTDLHSWADTITAIQKIEVLTEGPVGVGTRFRETRKMFGREATEEMEYLEFERPSGYLLGAESNGCRYRTRFRLEAVGDAQSRTKLTFEFQAEPLNLFAKIMAFLMKPMLKKVVGEVKKDLDDVKRVCEGAGASDPGTGGD